MSRLRGRFDRPVSDTMRRVSSSLAIDLPLAEDEVRASRAHVRMLGETGILTAAEAAALEDGLASVATEMAAGRFELQEDDEDIHMAVERRLTELLGDVGRKLHTARSRNDQVATDVRLWLRRRAAELEQAVGDLMAVLLQRAEADGRTLMPGYTHLQRGQPILLGHHLLAHAWALSRDRGRLRDASARADACPLGACALAGTPHPIDRTRTAELLGFGSLVENAVDAVSARDHLQEVVGACAILMAHLSRMAEELVLWSSAEFGFVRLGDGQATGSSIMPQKRNPDAAELVRGKAGRVFGDLVQLLALVKGLPLAYNRDLQEDRSALFDAVDTAGDSCALMTEVWRDLTVDSGRFEGELRGDPALATELADGLVEQGVPFREAHEAVGGLMRRLDEESRGLSDLTLEDLRAAHPAFPDDALDWLSPQRAVARRTSRGGTAWPEVERQIVQLRKTLSTSDQAQG